MTESKKCTSCQTTLSPPFLYCDHCGAKQPVAQATETHSVLPPELEVFDFKPWFPAGSYIGFGLKFVSPPKNTQSIHLKFEGALTEHGDKELTLYAKHGGEFEDRFECLAPERGGNIRLRVSAECVLSNNQREHYKTTVLIPLISNNWNEEFIRKNLKGRKLELKNRGGLLRQEGYQFGSNIDHLIIDNEDGIARVMGEIESGGALSWREHFTRIDAPTMNLPSKTNTACLHYLKGGRVKKIRVFAQKNLSLGRPMLSSDLWLTVHPIDNPSNHVLMDRISRQHALIRWQGSHFEMQDTSTSGTWLNRQSMGNSWHRLQDGDLIGFLEPAVLTFRVQQQTDLAIRLIRQENGTDDEEYLLLAPNTLQSDPAIEGNLLLSHHNDGFVLVPTSDDTELNKQACKTYNAISLHSEDRIKFGETTLDFFIEAYPGGSL